MIKISNMLYPVKRYLNIKSYSLRNTKMLKTGEILSTSTDKRLVEEQGRFLKRE